MKMVLPVVVLALAGAACSSKTAEPAPAVVAVPPPAANPAPPPAAAPAADFGGSCTVTVAGTVVCTDYPGDPDKVKEGCTTSASANITTAFAAGHCTTEALTGTCTMPGGTVNHYYKPAPVEAMQTACKNGNGTWSNP